MSAEMFKEVLEAFTRQGTLANRSPTEQAQVLVDMAEQAGEHELTTSTRVA